MSATPKRGGSPRQEADDALYELGIIASILNGLTVADLSASHTLCPAVVQWLAKEQEERVPRLEAAMTRGWRQNGVSAPPPLD